MTPEEHNKWSNRWRKLGCPVLCGMNVGQAHQANFRVQETDYDKAYHKNNEYMEPDFSDEQTRKIIEQEEEKSAIYQSQVKIWEAWFPNIKEILPEKKYRYLFDLLCLKRVKMCEVLEVDENGERVFVEPYYSNGNIKNMKLLLGQSPRQLKYWLDFIKASFKNE